MKKHLKNPTVRILIGLVLGLIVGLVFKEKAAVLQPIGDIFIRSIRMLVIPLVLLSITNSTSNMEDLTVLGRIGGKTISLYILTTALSAAIAITLGMITGIGKGISIVETGEIVATESPTISQIIVNMVPSNIISSMANGDTLPIIIFAILLGIAITIAGEKGKVIKNVIESGTEVIYSLVSLVVKTAPLGVFALIASGIGQNGAEIFTTLGKFVILVYVAVVFIIMMYMILIHFFSGMKVSEFVKPASKIFITAFTTRSSAATLPVTIKTSVEEIGIDRDIAEFTLPIGCTINMNGAAMLLALSAVLASNIYGIPLTLDKIVIAIMISTLSGIGMPGVPNSGVIFNIFLFTTLGLPVGTLIGLLASIESLSDMVCTACNVIGDVVSAKLVDHSEKKREQKLAKTPVNKWQN